MWRQGDKDSLRVVLSFYSAVLYGLKFLKVPLLLKLKKKIKEGSKLLYNWRRCLIGS